MKIQFRLLSALILVCVGMISCSKPVFDQDVGASEAKIFSKYGLYFASTTNAAKTMKDELRSGLAQKISNENAQVKEIYYKTKMGEHIFWLIQTSNTWIVISDVKIPKGVKF